MKLAQGIFPGINILHFEGYHLIGIVVQLNLNARDKIPVGVEIGNPKFKIKLIVADNRLACRNGDLILSNHRYSNVEVTYHVGIKRNFDRNFTSFMNFLLKEPGYHRLEDIKITAGPLT